MSRYTRLYDSIATLHSNTAEPDLIPAISDFPFPTMYRGQMDILHRVNPEESFCLCSHTGFGKTAVFLTLTRNTPSIVIEPRKFLQKQCGSYFGDFILYGRSEYPCHYAPSAASAPCLTKVSCTDTDFRDYCPKKTANCTAHPCKIFLHNGEYHTICNDCPYNKARIEAKYRVSNGETVICNFGNFWNLLEYTQTVVIDEADLFFREISAPMRLRYSTPKYHATDSILTLMTREVQGLLKAIADTTIDQKFRYTLQNSLYNANFLKEHSDLCFKYQRKDRIYIEIDPRNTNILAQKLFKGKRVIVVSATPGQFDYPAYSASIHQRCGIYMAPVGNLTSKSLKENPHLLNSAARAIEEISGYFEGMYDSEKVVVHCGNIGTHATGLNQILGPENCTLHESGRLMETLETFVQSDRKYLLVAAAEHGLDFEFCKLQFILKFPFPTLDERMNTLKRTLGPEFRNFYESEARTRVIQMAGRNVRGFNDFGVTICLDSKIRDDYMRNGKKYPDWFRERVDGGVY